MLKKLILSFTSLVIIGLVPFALSNQSNVPVINVAGTTPSGLATQDVVIDIVSIGSPSSNTLETKTVEIGVDNDVTRTFSFEGSFNRTAPSADSSSTWFRIYRSIDNFSIPFSVLTSKTTSSYDPDLDVVVTTTETVPFPGSVDDPSTTDVNEENKWRLTGLTMLVAKYSSTPTNVSVDIKNNINNTTYNIGSYASTTNSTALEDLNNPSNQTTLTLTPLAFANGIFDFSIIPSRPLVVSSMTLTYSIDYSAC